MRENPCDSKYRACSAFVQRSTGIWPTGMLRVGGFPNFDSWVFVCNINDVRVFVRFIPGDFERAATSMMSDLGIAPLVLASGPTGVILADAGKPIAEADDASLIRMVACTLRKLHSSLIKNDGDGLDRVRLDQAAILLDNAALQPAFEILRQCSGVLQKIRTLAEGFNPTRTFCHNDLSPGNILLNGSKMSIIDFDHCGAGDPMFDLATAANSYRWTTGQANLLITEYLARTPRRDEQILFSIRRCESYIRYAILTAACALRHEPNCGLTADIVQVGAFEKIPSTDRTSSYVLGMANGFAQAGLKRWNSLKAHQSD